MKKFLIHSLLKTYSNLTIILIVLVTILVSYNTYSNYIRSIDQVQRQLLNDISEELSYFQRQVKNDLYHYSRDTNKLDGITNYFNLSPSDYLLWLRRHPLAQDIQLSFHNNINDIYLDNEFVKSVDLSLVAEEEVFTSNRAFKSGRKQEAKTYKAPDNAFLMTMYDPRTSNLFATVFISIDTSFLDRLIASETNLPISIEVTDDLGRDFYSLNKLKEPLSYHRSIDGGLRVSVGFPSPYIIQEIGKLLFLNFLVSFVITLTLLALLRHIFSRYQKQVSDLVTSMQDITEKDNQIRIDTSSKEQEFLVISSQINQMLDSLDRTITENYQLQLAQKDANMRALQAQINPHFLYNTLEFLRMYAVTRDQEELADIIYEFASLLRGSISQKKETSIAEELDFCEKHSFICQIRHPKSIAYSYQIDKGCETLIIPRFSLQPLVENYFIHGVDLSKRNNALSVKVLKKDRDVIILIRDNGKGMSEAVLDKYSQLLEERVVSDSKAFNSIGILNVHERFLLHFGDAYKVELSETQGGGVTYTISLSNVLEESGMISLV